MTAVQQAEAQMFIRAEKFTKSLTPDFTHAPATLVDEKFAKTRTRLLKAIADLGGPQAIQAGGAFHQETEEQRGKRRSLLEELRDVVRSALSIAEETGNPGLMDRFRMPRGNSDQDVKATALAYAATIRELGLKDEFAALGHEEDAAADLEEMADDFQGSEGDQGEALAEQVGATASIPDALRAGKGAVKTFNALFHRIYADHTDKLAAWRSARHVERVARRKKTPDAPPEPPVA